MHQPLNDGFGVVLVFVAPTEAELGHWHAVVLPSGQGAFIATDDAAERTELMKKYQKLYTENLYGIGLTQYPGALIINKRFANIPAGAPIYMFQWAEDNIIRERVFVPADKQQNFELHPNTLPGEPGSAGPVGL